LVITQPAVAAATIFSAELQAATGGQLVANNLTLNVPDVAVGAGGASLSVEPRSAPSTSQPEPGFILGETTYRVRFVDHALGGDVPSPGVPLSLTYQPTALERALAGNDLNRLHPAVWSGAAWIPLPCDPSGDGVALTCSLAEINVLGVVIAPIVGGTFDMELPNGHFYKQANGYAGAGEGGFAVVDDADAAFWTEFERMGGISQLGYPISGRFQFRGFLTQVFQKLALQWRSELGAAVPINTLDELNQTAPSTWLQSNRQVPMAPDGSSEIGMPWDDVVSQHMALLNGYPALRAFYDVDPDALELYGLPLSVADYGPFVTVRLQRATFQLWTVDTPWAAAGTVVLGNSGDLAKEVGLWPMDALVPRPASAYAQLSPAN